MPIERLYTARASATGGRDGHARTDDGKVDVALSVPREMGGDGAGTNPEQLLAAGYSACYLGALGFVAKQAGAALPEGATVAAAVGIGKIEGGFGLAVDLAVTLPGLSREQAHDLVDRAHKVCPYSNATRGNVEVTTTLA